MPLKTTVGLTKKVGLPNYGSLGATCHVEFELDDTSIQQDPDAFHQQVRDVFAACSQAVHDELARQRGSTPIPVPVAARSTSNGNGHSHHPGSNNPSTPASGASDKQLIYLRRLASQIPDIGLRRLDEVAQNVCAKPVAALSTAEASHLIDGLKALKSGARNLHELLTGTQAGSHKQQPWRHCPHAARGCGTTSVPAA